MSSFDPDSFDLPLGHFINGRVESSSTGSIAVSRPSDGKQYGELPVAGAVIVDKAVSAAKAAQAHWAGLQPRERIAILRNWAAKVTEHTADLARIESATSTRPISDVISGDIPHLVESILFFSELADKRGGSVAPTGTQSFGFTVKEPYGVIGAILPWNYPLGVAGWKIAPALAGGNGVVVKPSEMTPASVILLARLAIEAGLPVGLLNIVQGTGPETGSLLTRHPDIDKLTFTGSTRAGRLIAEESARHGLKPLTLELGGKSPQVVFADADLERAAKAIARSILNNGGQECVAGSRVIVERSVSAKLTELLIHNMSAVTPGETWLDTTNYAPIVSLRQAQSVEADIALALDNGGKLLAGGQRIPGLKGYFLQPTVISVDSDNNPILQKEIFASALTIQVFDTEAEAVGRANSTSYGLAAGLHTNDVSRALRVMGRLDAGTVWVNRYGRTDDFIIPTGGFKQSGTGKDLGIEAFDANLRVKSVLMDL